MDLRALVETMHQMPPWAAYAVLFAGAFVEYVFPPAPGDLAVLAAAALVAAFGWDVVPVFAVVTAGSVLGGMADYAVGRWLASTGRVDRIRGKKKIALDLVLRKFEQHGVAYLVVNRFLPGVRAVFFLAAGMQRFAAWKVLLLGLVSATLWNLILIAIGYGVGRNLDELESIVQANGQLSLALVAVVLAWFAWKLRRAFRNEEITP